MIGLRPLTLIQKTDSGFITYSLQGNWQGVNGFKAAALGNVPDNAVTVRIPLNLLGSATISKGDFIALGNIEMLPGMTEKQLFAAPGGKMIRVRSVRVCDGISDRVNHLEVIGS